MLSADTLTSIATGLKNAINADSHLSTLGVTATSATAVVSINSVSTNATTYTSSTSSGATETIALTLNTNQNQIATVGGTITTSDKMTITTYDAGLSGGSTAISYTAMSGDTLTSFATGLTAAINASTNLKNIGVTATSSGAQITIQSNSPNMTTYRHAVPKLAIHSKCPNRASQPAGRTSVPILATQLLILLQSGNLGGSPPAWRFRATNMKSIFVRSHTAPLPRS